MSGHWGCRGPGHLSRNTYPIPSWVEPAAVLDRDYENVRFNWNRVSYPSEAALNTAIGGTKSGETRVIGPYLDPAATALMPNGTFATDVANWAAAGSNSAITWEAGELKAAISSSAGPNLGGAVGVITGKLGHAFKATGTTRKSASGLSNAGIYASITTAFTSGHIVTSAAAFNSTSNVTASGFGSINAATAYLGLRQGALSIGDYFLDNWSAIEAWPFRGWTPASAGGGGFAYAVSATTGSAVTGAEYLHMASSGSATDNNHVGIYRNNVTGVVTLEVKVDNATTVLRVLGTVAASTRFDVAYSVAQDDVRASLNGIPVTPATSCVVPGASVLVSGKAYISNLPWTGVIHRETVW